MEKVFCGDCEFYQALNPESPTIEGAADMCRHPHNKIDTYLSKGGGTKRQPRQKNNMNNCPNWKLREQ